MSSWDCFCMLCSGPLKMEDVVVGNNEEKALRKRDEKIRRKMRQVKGRNGVVAEHGVDSADEDKDDADAQRPSSSIVQNDLYHDHRSYGRDFHYYEKHFYDPRLLTKKDVAWLDQCRTLGFNPNTERAFVSGLGKYYDWGEFHISETGTDPNDPQPEFGEVHVCYVFDGTTFPFHEACYDILAKRLGYHSPADVNKDALYDAVFDIGAAKDGESLALDYGGDFSKRFWECQLGEEYCVTCPGDGGFELRDTIWKHIPSTLYLASAPTDLSSRVRHDPLAVLQFDILDTVLGHLSVHDSLNLMKASHYVCSTTRDSSFWRSMIRMHLAPWLWEVREMVAGHEIRDFDYKGLFLWLEEATKPQIGMKWPFMGVANRRRIWGVCGLLVDAYRAQLEERLATDI